MAGFFIFYHPCDVNSRFKYLTHELCHSFQWLGGCKKLRSLLQRAKIITVHFMQMFSNDDHTLVHTHTQFYSDRAVQRDVMDVLVKCENLITGCPWSGQLKNWEVRRGGKEGMCI